jgi:hypothetical protein
MAENEQPQPKFLTIPLDGTYGPGPACEVTVVTRESAESTRNVETTFTIPYALLSVGALVKMMDINLISGYRIEKQPMPNPLREMGL